MELLLPSFRQLLRVPTTPHLPPNHFGNILSSRQATRQSGRRKSEHLNKPSALGRVADHEVEKSSTRRGYVGPEAGIVGLQQAGIDTGEHGLRGLADALKVGC